MLLEPILSETLWKRVGVRDWGLLLSWELLIHVEGVVVHHKGHEHGQEPGDELHLLSQEKTHKWSCSVPHPSPAHLTLSFLDISLQACPSFPSPNTPPC